MALKTWVQQVPKAKSSKSRETDRKRDVGGIVQRAGECRPIRQSGGTQYSKAPCESLTQLLGVEEEGGKGTFPAVSLPARAAL